MNKLIRISAIATCLSISILTSCTDKNSSSGNGGDIEKKPTGTGDNTTNGGTDYNNSNGSSTNSNSSNNMDNTPHAVNNGSDSTRSR